MDEMPDGFKKLHRLPRRYIKARMFKGCASKIEYVYAQSRKRFEARDDAFKDERDVLATGEFGTVSGVTFIVDRIIIDRKEK